jgi:hypothetical protein
LIDSKHVRRTKSDRRTSEKISGPESRKSTFESEKRGVASSPEAEQPEQSQAVIAIAKSLFSKSKRQAANWVIKGKAYAM